MTTALDAFMNAPAIIGSSTDVSTPKSLTPAEFAKLDREVKELRVLANQGVELNKDQLRDIIRLRRAMLETEFAIVKMKKPKARKRAMPKKPTAAALKKKAAESKASAFLLGNPKK